MRVFLSFFSSLSGKFISKICPIVLGEILKVFVNTWIAADKYPIQDCENLRLPIQIQLSEKGKVFSAFFCSIPGIYIKFLKFRKK